MEIFMRSISWSVGHDELTRELAEVLHSPLYESLIPRMNFNVHLIRDMTRMHSHRGIGFLTLPTKEVGQQFLDDYGGHNNKLEVRNRRIRFSKSKHDGCYPGVLERITQLPYIDPQSLRESEARVAMLQSRFIHIKSVQFGWECRDDTFSIEWETTQLSTSTLSFDPERNEIRIMLQFNHSSTEYFIALRYSHITYVSAHRGPSESSIFFSLSVPPSFEHQYSNTADSPRQRLDCFPFAEHARVAPYASLALRLICSADTQIPIFRDMCQNAELHAKVDDLEILAAHRGLFSAPVISQYEDWIRRLHWDVAFQVEGIVRAKIIDVVEMLSLEKEVSDSIEKHGTAYASSLLRHFGGRLYVYDEIVADMHQSFKAAAIEFAQLSMAPSHRSIDSSLFQSLHVTVTPTTMILDGPFPERSNRVIRSYHPSNHNSFLRVSFVDEGGLAYRFDRDIDGPQFLRQRVGGLLFNGLNIAGRVFHFLAYSQSALKEHTVWFVKEFVDPERGLVNADTIIRSLGQFSGLSFDRKLIYCPARYAARLSQAFTATDASVSVEVEEIQMLRDIKAENENYCFTDGVGTISTGLAKEIWRELTKARRGARKSKANPKAFQIRFQGSKGMVSVDYRLSGRALRLRDSMVKFESPHSTEIEVARAFDRPGAYFLNRPLIMLLEGLGVPYETFKKFQDLAIQETQNSVLSISLAAKMLESHGLGASYRIPSVLTSLNKHGIETLASNSFWKKTTEFAVHHVLRELRNHARIPVPGAWTLVGIADEHGFLQEGEIFACVKPRDEHAIYLEGDILISRSPTIHPGDVQIVRAIGLPRGSCFEKEPLANTVVFSTKGKRPLPSCLGGGDLDGDVYNLLPLEQMPEFKPTTIGTPATYDPAPKRILNRPSEIKDIAEFVLQFISSDVVGIIAINWLIIADQSKDGIFDKDCLELAKLHSDAVDYPKSGTPIELERIPKLKYKAKPDWNAPETAKQHSAKYYESGRAIGRLFRDIKLPAEQITASQTHHRRRRRSSRMENTPESEMGDYGVSSHVVEVIDTLMENYLGDQIWAEDSTLNDIKRIYDRYVSELRAICATHALSHSHSSWLTEEEAFTGTIIAKTSQLRKRKDLISRLREQTDLLVRGVREELAGNEDMSLEEVLERAWIAWDYALSKTMAFGAHSFTWVSLGSIFETVRQIDNMRVEDAHSRFY
ncbi:hypothetical protein AX17_000172 [Amanita inopinata Kibby_2008]|nr:hypothetical protein AX17_000172 [Amanita inopinata Kibby_2008]